MNRYMHDYVHMLTQKCGMNPLFAQHFIPFFFLSTFVSHSFGLVCESTMHSAFKVWV